MPGLMKGTTGQTRVFLVLFSQESESAKTRLTEAYPSHYQLNPTTFAIRTQDLAEHVARTVGIKGPGRFISGVVFRLNHVYAGYYRPDLWDWMGEERTSETVLA